MGNSSSKGDEQGKEVTFFDGEKAASGNVHAGETWFPSTTVSAWEGHHVIKGTPLSKDGSDVATLKTAIKTLEVRALAAHALRRCAFVPAECVWEEGVYHALRWSWCDSLLPVWPA